MKRLAAFIVSRMTVCTLAHESDEHARSERESSVILQCGSSPYLIARHTSKQESFWLNFAQCVAGSGQYNCHAPVAAASPAVTGGQGHCDHNTSALQPAVPAAGQAVASESGMPTSQSATLHHLHHRIYQMRGSVIPHVEVGLTIAPAGSFHPC